MTYTTTTARASTQYPNFPGSRDNAPETSREAARTIVDVARTHRLKVLEALKGETFGLSSEAIAGKIGLTKYSVRPRISELVASGEVIETPFREKNSDGRSVVIWRAAQ
jgi:predicted ArsR family transcriptional regulator